MRSETLARYYREICLYQRTLDTIYHYKGSRPNGTKLTIEFVRFSTGKTQKWALTVDGKPVTLPPGGNINAFTFSPDGSHFAFFSPGGAKPGIYLDGKLSADNHYHAFTPDSQHLFWFSFEAAKARPTTAYESKGDCVTYLDGQRAASVETTAATQAFYPNSPVPPYAGRPTWEVDDKGVLTFLGPVGDDMKRITVTPSADTSVETLFAAAK